MFKSNIFFIGPSREKLLKLSNSASVLITLFNKKRGSEAGRITINQLNRPAPKVSDDVMKTLTDLEIHLANKYSYLCDLTLCNMHALYNMDMDIADFIW